MAAVVVVVVIIIGSWRRGGSIGVGLLAMVLVTWFAIAGSKVFVKVSWPDAIDAGGELGRDMKDESSPGLHSAC